MPKLSKPVKPLDLTNAPPIASIKQTELVLNKSRSSVCRMIADGRLRAIKIGRSVGVDTQSIKSLLETSPAATYRTAA